MKKLTYYQICYKTLSGREVETPVYFTNLPETQKHLNTLNTKSWDTKYFFKKHNILIYEYASEISTEQQLDR